jgi:NAD(P)-dependent dehydrogenase (short-subunit alcohol dehydrogenase family)
VIVGGKGGIGKAIACALAAAGADIAVASRSAAAGSAAGLELHGVRCMTVQVDIRSADSVSRCYTTVADAFGKVDILVNSAGACHNHFVCGHSDESWQEVIDTNLNGVYRTIKICLPGMIERKWGRIINIASDIALVGVPEYAAYCASKAAVVSLTRCVALEAASYGVSCNAISPGWVDTELARRAIAEAAASQGREMTDYIENVKHNSPQKRMITPEEIAALSLFLCREEARGITMQDITVSGGALW